MRRRNQARNSIQFVMLRRLNQVRNSTQFVILRRRNQARNSVQFVILRNEGSTFAESILLNFTLRNYLWRYFVPQYDKIVEDRNGSACVISHFARNDRIVMTPKAVSNTMKPETPHSLSSWGTKDLRLLNPYRWTSLYGITREDTSFLRMTKLWIIETQRRVWFLILRNDRIVMTPKTVSNTLKLETWILEKGKTYGVVCHFEEWEITQETPYSLSSWGREITQETPQFCHPEEA
jgi:hypothetical protein